MMAIYTDSVFRVGDLDAARRIILTPERGLDTDTRWREETPWLASLMQPLFKPDGLLLDFGCGVGRLARAWLEANPAGRALGVDLSPEMRRLAADYVASERFSACAPAYWQGLLDDGLRCDGAVACWIIQHVFDPAAEVARIHRMLRPGGRLLLVNNRRRAVPTEQGWVDDGVDVAALVARHFVLEQEGRLPVAIAGDYLAEHSFVAIYRRPEEA